MWTFKQQIEALLHSGCSGGGSLPVANDLRVCFWSLQTLVQARLHEHMNAPTDESFWNGWAFELKTGYCKTPLAWGQNLSLCLCLQQIHLFYFLWFCSWWLNYLHFQTPLITLMCFKLLNSGQELFFLWMFLWSLPAVYFTLPPSSFLEELKSGEWLWVENPNPSSTHKLSSFIWPHPEGMKACKT